MPVLSPYALGATLYMPVIHKTALDVVLGRKIPGLRSVVLCLEDALADNDVEAGLESLRRLLATLQHEHDIRGPLVFIRPRSVEMAKCLATWPGMDGITGFIAPKFRAGQMRGWFNAVAGTHLLLMPTLETAEMFDPAAVREFRDELLSFDRTRVLALRVGGNDLLACLGLRRIRSLTTYDGSLGHAAAMLVGLLVPAGFSLTAPVFEILDDTATLQRELRHDLAYGFVGKTAIHPIQVPLIQAAFSVEPADLDAARRILGNGAAAVFQLNGAMCEPKTHLAWAARIVERAQYFGVSQQPVVHHPEGLGVLAA